MSTTCARTARHLELHSEYRGQIERGKLAVGDRLPSYPELRRQGYSQATVDRAFQRLGDEGLIRRTNGRGIFVAQTQVRQIRTGMVGLLGLRDGSHLHPYWSELLAGAQDALGEGEMDVALPMDISTTRWERLDGVLAFGYAGHSHARQRPVTMPVVGMMVGEPTMACVEADVEQGLFEAVRHLHQLGHQRIGYLTLDPWGAGRTKWFCEALQKLGMPIDPKQIHVLDAPEGVGTDYFSRLGYLGMQNWLASNWEHTGCTAMLAWNDEMALGVRQALKEAGIGVPDQVSVVGFDGSPLTGSRELPLTTVEIPLRAIGHEAAGLLLRQLRGEEVRPGKRFWPLKLRVAGSTAPPTR